jgi:hypothetical protein
MASCAKQTTFYGCTNATGTTCTKTAIQTVYINDAPCSATSSYVLTQAEYNKFGSTTLNPEVIEAELLIFAATLTALCLFFGLKWVYRLLTGGVGHE